VARVETYPFWVGSQLQFTHFNLRHDDCRNLLSRPPLRKRSERGSSPGSEGSCLLLRSAGPGRPAILFEIPQQAAQRAGVAHLKPVEKPLGADRCPFAHQGGDLHLPRIAFSQLRETFRVGRHAQAPQRPRCMGGECGRRGYHLAKCQSEEPHFQSA